MFGVSCDYSQPPQCSRYLSVDDAAEQSGAADNFAPAVASAADNDAYVVAAVVVAAAGDYYKRYYS